MPEKRSAETEKKSLEHQIFIFSALLGTATAIFLFVLDFFIFHSPVAYSLELFAMVIFLLFWYFGREPAPFEKIVNYWVLVLLLVADAGWCTSSGCNSTSNLAIINLAITASVGMLSKRACKVYYFIWFFNALGLTAFDYYVGNVSYYDTKLLPEISLYRNIYGFIISFSQVYIVSFIKKKYDQERITIHTQMVLLDKAYGELESQNEALIRQNEEILSQREQIEYTNQQLNIKSDELKAAFAKIVDYNLNLEQMVQTRTAEILELNKELDLIFYRSSHDFKAPLMTLKGLEQLGYLSTNQAEQAVLWQKVGQTTQKLDRMIKKLEMISNINNFQSDETANLQEAVHSTLKLFSAQLAEFKVKTSFETQYYTPADPRNRLLKIILENLVENAVQFCQEEAKHELAISIIEDLGILTLTVTDHGRGIPEALLKKVAEMFFRGSEHSEGNGLGLYVVNVAVKKLSGTFSIVSAVGEGTTATVSFTV